MSPRTGFAALVAISLHAVLAIQIARADRSARHGDARVGSHAWIIGPAGASLAAAADAEIDRAVQQLDRTGAGATGWYDAYRADLTAAGDLLARSLRARPSDPKALARLAAVRWELDGPPAGGTGEDAKRLIALAEHAAPGSAPVQILLGELLLRMGRIDDAAEPLRRAVELDETLAARAVRALRDHTPDAPGILDLLPPSPAVLLAVQPAFFEDGNPAGYLDVLERSLPSGEAALLFAYAESCLKFGRADRLAATMDALPPFEQPKSEAERLHARSRALVALGDPGAALQDARRAQELSPEDSRVIEQAGLAALASSDAPAAIDAFRQALGVAARRGGSTAVRARLYRLIGSAEERRGRADRAFEAYLKTLELDPADTQAGRRVAELRRAAGVAPPPR